MLVVKNTYRIPQENRQAISFWGKDEHNATLVQQVKGTFYFQAKTNSIIKSLSFSLGIRHSKIPQ